MKRKFLALFLTASLALSMTACGSDDSSAASTTGSTQTETESGTESSESEGSDSQEEAETEDQDTAETETPSDVDPMEAALENMNSVTSMDAQMVMEMDMTMEAEGEQQVIESVTTMDMTYISDPMKIKMDMEVDMGAQGSMSMSVYADTDEDGNYMMYVFDGASWSAAPIAGMEDLAQYDARNSMVSSIGDGDLYTAEGTETVDGVNAYKYSYTMTGDEMKEALTSSGALDSLSSLGMTASDVSGMLDGLGEVVTYVWIDEATLYPIKYEMDMTDVMDALMATIVEAMGEEAEGMTMHVPTMTMTMTCSNFNSAEDFTVPEEALSAVAAATTTE